MVFSRIKKALKVTSFLPNLVTFYRRIITITKIYPKHKAAIPKPTAVVPVPESTTTFSA